MTPLLRKIDSAFVSEDDVYASIDTSTVNVQKKDGSTAFWISCVRLSQGGKFERIALKLLDLGADPRLGPANKHQAIILATQYNCISVLTKMIEKGAEVNCVSPADQSTALMNAACIGHIKACTILLQNGADPNKQNTMLATALHGVVQTSSNIAIAGHLVKSGAALIPDNTGTTPLHQIYQKNRVDRVSHLLAMQLLEAATKEMLDAHTPQPFLAFAAAFGTGDVVKKAIQKGADPDIFYKIQNDQNGPIRPLVTACGVDNVETFRALVESGADTSKIVDGIGIFCIAAQFNATKVLSYLLSQDIDPNQPNSIGQTACHIACVTNHTQILTRLLADRRVDPNKRADDGATALHAAAQNGSLEALKLICPRIDTINAALTTDGATALMLAAQNGYTAVVAHLLLQGATQTLVRSDGLSALSLACRYGHLQTVELLLEKSTYNSDQQKYFRAFCWINIDPRKGMAMLQKQISQLEAKEKGIESQLESLHISSSYQVPQTVTSSASVSAHAFLQKELGLSSNEIAKLKEATLSPSDLQPEKKEKTMAAVSWLGGKLSSSMPQILPIESEATPNCYLYLDLKSLEKDGFTDDLLLQHFPLRFCPRDGAQGIKTLTENIPNIKVRIGNKEENKELRYELKVTSSGSRILCYTIQEKGNTLIVSALFVKNHDRLNSINYRKKKVSLFFPEM